MGKKGSNTHSAAIVHALNLLLGSIRGFRIQNRKTAFVVLVYNLTLNGTVVGCLKYYRFLDMIIPNTIKKNVKTKREEYTFTIL